MFSWSKKNEIKEAIKSPNGQIICYFHLKSNQLSYSIDKEQTNLIKLSRLGITICGEQPLAKNLRLIRKRQHKHRETIELPWGEDRYIKNNYTEAIFYLAEKQEPKRLITLRFRVFDNGVAFRYEIPPQLKFRQISIKDELTEFNVRPYSLVWQIPAYQPDRYEYNYEKTLLQDLTRPIHTPTTIRTPDGMYLAIHEAALYNYGAMNLTLRENLALKSDITPLSDGTRAHVNLPFQTPWRLIMIADSATSLTTNRLIYALNEPPAKDFSWVKTLKFIGIWWAMYVGEWTWAPGERHGATTAHAKSYIDSAVKLGISGLLIEGWNDGWEGDWLTNGASTHFTLATSDFDLPAVAKYAKKHHIELIGHHETVGFVDNYEQQLEEAYNQYLLNGVHYIKIGYAGEKMLVHGRREYHHSQVGVNHYQKVVELAAKKHVCLNIHEPIKGTGIERTWPNLLTREGGRGQEYEGGSLQPSHACYLPYTRLLAGGMDYTSGIFDLQNNVKRVATTLARQLAYYVTIYSGMQMAADRPDFYQDKYPAAFQFIQDVPTNFSQTIPLAGEIGEYYLVARKDRDSQDWYLGGITNETSRRVRINLSTFLTDGTYLAEIYRDSHDAHYQKNPFGIVIEKRQMSYSDTLDLYLAPGGGFAIRLKRL